MEIYRNYNKEKLNAALIYCKGSVPEKTFISMRTKLFSPSQLQRYLSMLRRKDIHLHA